MVYLMFSKTKEPTLKTNFLTIYHTMLSHFNLNIYCFISASTCLCCAFIVFVAQIDFYAMCCSAVWPTYSELKLLLFSHFLPTVFGVEVLSAVEQYLFVLP